jgi:hypothetical protein
MHCRTVWILMVLGLIGYFLLAISMRLQKLSTYPVSSRMQVVDVDEAEFPAMTICNMNYLKKPYMEKDDFMKNVILALNSFTASTSNVNI